MCTWKPEVYPGPQMSESCRRRCWKRPVAAELQLISVVSLGALCTQLLPGILGALGVDRSWVGRQSHSCALSTCRPPRQPGALSFLSSLSLIFIFILGQVVGGLLKADKTKRMR